jgi:hypothetical protein
MEHKKKEQIQGYNNKKNTEEFIYALVEVSIKTKHCYIACRGFSVSLCHRRGTPRFVLWDTIMISLSLPQSRSYYETCTKNTF